MKVSYFLLCTLPLRTLQPLGHFHSFRLLQRRVLLPVPHIEGLHTVQDEHISLVQGLYLCVYQDNAHATLALNSIKREILIEYEVRR